MIFNFPCILNNDSTTRSLPLYVFSYFSAGFGGLGCGVECFARTPLGLTDQSSTSIYRQICSQLCDNGLGNIDKCREVNEILSITQYISGTQQCNCASSAANADTISAKNALCSAKCSHRSFNMTGCSPCSLHPPTKDYEQTTTVDGEGNSDYSESEQSTTVEAVPTDDDGSTSEEGDTTTDADETEEDTTIEETTTTTTTTQATTTTTRTTTLATTTPNWESMCEALCRNGEGGSLCNCDIPPFF